MKKLVLMTIMLVAVSNMFASTNTNNYVRLGVGLYDSMDSNDVEYKNEELYAISVGRYFNEQKCALELEVNTVKYDVLENYSYSTATTTIDGGTDGTPAIVPVKPGNGIGHAWGWYRKNPIIPAVPPTPATTNITTTINNGINDINIRLTSALVNAEYRLTSDSFITPYLSIGCGLTVAQIDTDFDNWTETGFTYQGGLGLDFESKSDCVYLRTGARYYNTTFEGGFDLYGIQYIAGLEFNF